ncbi:hypothetical protein EAG_01271 [Camponotus floridanus]|uniref:Uncharacterized protein n=1 Tax=Camponotus floridanus TaxID=104421 RepID=E1ZV27_CAMFO|nr:hypothetical protein EAG_01271 [Camponotus floridanus]
MAAVSRMVWIFMGSTETSLRHSCDFHSCVEVFSTNHAYKVWAVNGVKEVNGGADRIYYEMDGEGDADSSTTPSHNVDHHRDLLFDVCDISLLSWLNHCFGDEKARCRFVERKQQSSNAALRSINNPTSRLFVDLSTVEGHNELVGSLIIL